MYLMPFIHNMIIIGANKAVEIKSNLGLEIFAYKNVIIPSVLVI
jgi:hypothetical protein